MQNDSKEATDGAVQALSKPRKGIYILPSLVTTASLFVGFYAIVQANAGMFSVFGGSNRERGTEGL